MSLTAPYIRAADDSFFFYVPDIRSTSIAQQSSGIRQVVSPCPATITRFASSQLACAPWRFCVSNSIAPWSLQPSFLSFTIIPSHMSGTAAALFFLTLIPPLALIPCLPSKSPLPSSASIRIPPSPSTRIPFPPLFQTPSSPPTHKNINALKWVLHAHGFLKCDMSNFEHIWLCRCHASLEKPCKSHSRRGSHTLKVQMTGQNGHLTTRAKETRLNTKRTATRKALS